MNQSRNEDSSSDESPKIEHGIPYPQRRRKYHFEKLGISDSFFIKDGNLASALGSANKYGKNQNPKWKFVGENVEGGIRIWRIE